MTAERNENTTTCWGCAEDFPDREMLPRPCGEGEFCFRCAEESGEFETETIVEAIP